MGDDFPQVTWYANRDSWQPLTNAHEVPERHLQRELISPIPVRVRLILQRDGVEFLDTLAVGWAGQLVHVQLRDVRSRAAFAWVHVEHIQRR